ncbi:MAG: phosphoenolpyruvate synthase [Pseudomonadota bacterium]
MDSYDTRLVIPLDQLRRDDVPQVGGKNASLGEMLGALGPLGIRVPGGFATTAQAYRGFLAQDGLDHRIPALLATLDVADVDALARCGQQIRDWILATPLPAALESAVRAAFAQAAAGCSDDVSWAVRSSATAEDLPTASFAGQQETYLNVRGIDGVLEHLRRVFASLYTDRAIAYRVHQGFRHEVVALSAAVQRMVRSDLGASGVMFTLDTESGFRDVVLVTSTWGLGEPLVQGAVNPDEFHVHKPTLARGKTAVIRRQLGSKRIRMVFDAAHVRTEETPEALQQRFSLADAQVQDLARMAVSIEQHYGCPMDIEWGLDGLDGQLYILQARPETVQSRRSGVAARPVLQARSRVLLRGQAIGHLIGAGRVRKIAAAADRNRVQAGDVLVADMTDPDWEPVMQRAAAIVTDRGGRTCHAAIIARELGIPAVVGCVDALQRLTEGQPVTVSCAEGERGEVLEGLLPFTAREDAATDLPPAPVKLMMNVGNPQRAYEFAQLPGDGVGLARLEFIIANLIGLHPKAVLEVDALDAPLRREVLQAAQGYADPRRFFVDKLAEGIATIAAAFWPRPVVVRLSDFKSNEYRKLRGGDRYEPEEENPMLGFRGASRFIAPDFAGCFAMECEALRQVRGAMGLTNVQVMVPFVRTLGEAAAVEALLAQQGLARGSGAGTDGQGGLQLIMMCEIPANVLLAAEFLQHFDGFSIGSNDLTQLTLGVDRDSALVASAFDERDPAVKQLLARAIEACHAAGKRIGICGQGPSDHPDLAQWLVAQGIDSLSLNPDSVASTWQRLVQRKV